MDQPTTREIQFDPDDLALLRRAVRHVHDNFEDMTPAFTITVNFGFERVHELLGKIAKQEAAQGGVTVLLTKIDMHALGQVVWWSADWYEDFWLQAGVSEQDFDDLLDRLCALREDYFPRQDIR